MHIKIIQPLTSIADLHKNLLQIMSLSLFNNVNHTYVLKYMKIYLLIIPKTFQTSSEHTCKELISYFYLLQWYFYLINFC